MLTTAQLQALKNEFTNDPAALGYTALGNALNWNGLRDAVNLPRAGIIIRRTDVQPYEVLEAIDVRDFPAAPTGVNNIPLAQSWLESITQFPTIRLFNDDDTQTRTKNNLDRLIGNTQGSQTRLNAVGKRDGSRAELLFGRNISVTDGEVETAWKLP